MTMLKKAGLATVIAAAMLANAAMAKVSAEDAKKLGISGTPLTPLGAERAGNAAGTIPAWTGGITQPPSGFTADIASGFPGGQILAVLTALPAICRISTA